MTKQQLASACGLSPRMLRSYERGDYPPSPRLLEQFAGALRFPESFFLSDDVDEPSVDGVSFRALKAMTARQRDQAIGSASIALVLDDWIRRRFTLPAPDVPQADGADPELAAETVREAWGLGQKRAPNMVHLLEAHGVRVYSLVQECREVDAFSFWRAGAPYVFLNGVKTAEHSRTDAAHELGHLVMHSHGAPAGRQAEDQAQAFARAFLMPRRSVLAEAPAGATVTEILQLRRRWNVAAMNLAVRLHKLGLLTEWQARSTYIELAQLGYRRSEPGGIERETSQVLSKVFAALRAEGITRSQVARELCIPLEELNRSIFGLTLTTASSESAPRSDTSPPTTPGRPDLRVVCE